MVSTRFVRALVLLSLAACSTPNVAHRDALRDARGALDRGDLVEATLAYRRACQADAQDKTSCQAAATFGNQALDAALARARPRCGPEKDADVDVPGCLEALYPARRLEPAHPELLRLADRAGAVAIARCRPGSPTTPEEAVALWRCANQYRAAVGTPSFEANVKAVGSRAAGVFVDLAAREANQGHAGAQYALWTAAACFDADREIGRRAAVVGQEFAARAAAPLQLSVELGGVPVAPETVAAICPRSASLLAGRAVCRASDEPSALALTLRLSIAPPRHLVGEERRSVTWQAGVNRWENPAYRTAAQRLRRAEDDVREIELLARERVGRCEAAERSWREAASCTSCEQSETKNRLCAEAEAAASVLRDRTSARDDARRELDRTPAMLEEADMRSTSYSVRRHEWQVTWNAELALAGGPAVRFTGERRVADETHDGVPEAGLGADPLSPPPAGWYEGAVGEEVAAHAAELAGVELSRRAAARRATCRGDAPVWTAAWLDCWAEATLWGGSTPVGLELLTGTAHAADRAAGRAVLPEPRCESR